MSSIEDDDRQDAQLEKQNVLLAKNADITKEGAQRLNKMRTFRKNLNHESTIGAKDFISKMKNAIHFIKKGALDGNNKDAEKGLNDSLARMGQMMGQPPKLFPH